MSSRNLYEMGKATKRASHVNYLLFENSRVTRHERPKSLTRGDNDLWSVYNTHDLVSSGEYEKRSARNFYI